MVYLNDAQLTSVVGGDGVTLTNLVTGNVIATTGNTAGLQGVFTAIGSPGAVTASSNANFGRIDNGLPLIAPIAFSV